ncbi:MAG: tRNA 2-thiouridine(34) synthase MnmA [Dehalococcoidia bacterium]
MVARVAVAMSGGTDSSVAAALLKEQGHEVVGVTMEVWAGEARSAGGPRHGCYGPSETEDVEDAREVARILGIPFYTFDLREEYRSSVLDYFCHEYLSGRTPNPCVRCNRRIKFEALVEKAQANGIECDYLATGHYARVEFDEGRGRYLLKKARDLGKDQSYFLFALSQEQLGRSLFPVGTYTKDKVRRLASDFGLGVGSKPESQNFMGGGYASLIEDAARPGPVLDRLGNVLGWHRGIPFYTIGQRRGLGISGGERLYVNAIDPEKNAIVVGSKDDVYGDELVASELNWVAIERLQRTVEVKAKVRYLHTEAEAIVAPLNGCKAHVKFKEPQMAITPGQAVVFYDGDIVIGGGTIESTGR